MTFVPRSGRAVDMPKRCPLAPEPARIREVHRETESSFTIALDPPAGRDRFAFVAGQFNMLYVFGIGEVAISMSGDAGDPAHIVHTVREVGVVTRAIGRLRKHDVLGVRGPYGRPWPLDTVRGADLLLIAGGIGLAPLRPALYHVIRHRADYGRVALLYGARTPKDVLYTRELDTWQKAPDLQILVTVDRAEGTWRKYVGVVPALLRFAEFDPERAIALVCGPEVMMRFTVRELERSGVADDRIYLSMERNMKCAVGFCGHCQYGPSFVCKDGPVYAYDRIRPLFPMREI